MASITHEFELGKAQEYVFKFDLTVEEMWLLVGAATYPEHVRGTGKGREEKRFVFKTRCCNDNFTFTISSNKVRDVSCDAPFYSLATKPEGNKAKDYAPLIPYFYLEYKTAEWPSKVWTGIDKGVSYSSTRPMTREEAQAYYQGHLDWHRSQQ